MDIPAYPPNKGPGFIAAGLDRNSHWRVDADKLQRELASAELILLHRYRMPMQAGELQTCAANEYFEFLDQAIWLGVWNDRSIYALDLESCGQEPPAELNFHDLRGAALRLDADHAAVMAYARAMVYWQKRHRYCGSCGLPTQARQAGHVLYCAHCELEHYPRSDPSMIVQVSDEQDRCLLGRQPNWPKGMWSVLAGFVEPGESIEDAVVREVWEEARIRVTGMRYSASQPWPFPASILLGFHASGIGAQPQVEQDELEDAAWFSRAQIEDGVRSKSLFLPPPFTLSWHLIAGWFDLGGTALEDILKS